MDRYVDVHISLLFIICFGVYQGIYSVNEAVHVWWQPEVCQQHPAKSALGYWKLLYNIAVTTAQGDCPPKKNDSISRFSKCPKTKQHLLLFLSITFK